MDAAVTSHFVKRSISFLPSFVNIAALMNFNDYQREARKTAAYPPIGHGVIYPTLGLVNEAGEVAGKIKKLFATKPA